MSEPVQPALVGRRILVTRPRDQAAPLVEHLRALGAEPLVCPTIRIEPLTNLERFRVCADHLDEYDWIVFTSANGVRLFAQLMAGLGSANVPAKTKIASIGSATSEALRSQGWPVALEPEEFVAEALLEALGNVGGQRILLPAASTTREVLPEGLRQRGATVEILPLYQTVPGEGISEAAHLLRIGAVDALTFTSSSTIEALLEGLEREGWTPAEAAQTVNRARVVCIGPVTAETARRRGLRVDAVPAEHTVEGIAASLTQLFRSEASQ